MVRRSPVKADGFTTAIGGRTVFRSRHPELLADAAFEPSVGRTADRDRNALPAAINELRQVELICRRVPWKTKMTVETAMLECVHWFSNDGLIANIGRAPSARRFGLLLQHAPLLIHAREHETASAVGRLPLIKRFSSP